MDRRECNTEDTLRLGQMEFFNREKCTGGIQKRMSTIDKLNKIKDKEQNDEARKQPEGLEFFFEQDDTELI